MDATFRSLTKLEEALAPLGVTLDDAEAVAIGRSHAAAVEAARSNPLGDLGTDLAAGNIPVEDVADRVRETCFMRAAQTGANDVLLEIEQALGRRVGRWFRERGDTVILAMQPIYTATVEKLAKAISDLHGTTDPVAALELGASGAKAWSARREALATLGQIREVVRRLSLASYGETAEDVCWWIQDVRDEEDLALQRSLFEGHQFNIAALIVYGTPSR